MNAILLVATGVSLLLAGFMSAIAWHLSRGERRRSDARVAALASTIYDEAVEEASIASRIFDEPPATSRAAASCRRACRCVRGGDDRRTGGGGGAQSTP